MIQKILSQINYSFEDLLDCDDLEALRDRFERCDELDAYETFCDKMCPHNFAWAMYDTRRNLLHEVSILSFRNSQFAR